MGKIMARAYQPLSAHEQVLRVLDSKVSDIYSHTIRSGLAECALRHVDKTQRQAVRVKRAVKWLRDMGHL